MTQEEEDAALLRPRPLHYELTRFWILRGLGAIYLVAFLSLAHQIAPLVGPHGLLPADAMLEGVRAEGVSAIVRAPTIFLAIAPTDDALRALAWLGVVLAGLVMLGASNALLMAALWVLQLSFIEVGQDFWAFGC